MAGLIAFVLFGGLFVGLLLWGPVRRRRRRVVAQRVRAQTDAGPLPDHVWQPLTGAAANADVLLPDRFLQGAIPEFFRNLSQFKAPEDEIDEAQSTTIGGVAFNVFRHEHTWYDDDNLRRQRSTAITFGVPGPFPALAVFPKFDPEYHMTGAVARAGKRIRVGRRDFDDMFWCYCRDGGFASAFFSAAVLDAFLAEARLRFVIVAESSAFAAFQRDEDDDLDADEMLAFALILGRRLGELRPPA